ncbi:MAG: hypothetical protein ACKOW9_05085 [Candidatus Paceibacterota bacterium]
MKYFRHAHLTFWFVAAFFLSSVLFYSYNVGKDIEINSGKSVFRQADVNKYALELLMVVSAGYPSITSANYGEWSSSVLITAESGLRAVSGTESAQPSLIKVWENAVENAKSLVDTDPNDTSSVVESISRMGQSAQNVAIITHGGFGRTIVDSSSIVFPIYQSSKEG